VIVLSGWYAHSIPVCTWWCPRRSFGIVVCGRLVDLLVEVGEPGPIFGPGAVVEHGVGAVRRGRYAEQSPDVHRPAGCGRQSGDVVQALGVGDMDGAPGEGQGPHGAVAAERGGSPADQVGPG